MIGPRQILMAAALGASCSLVVASPVLATEAATTAAGTPAGKPPVAASAQSVPKLAAAQIVEKNVAARGGAPAWKVVQSLQLTGKIDAGHGDSLARAKKLVNSAKKASGKGTNAEVAAANDAEEPAKEIQLPFTLDVKRPNKTRMEVLFDGKTAVQVFDGQHGWKLRPFLNRNDAEPFTADELKAEVSRGDLDGPLIDYAAKGTKVVLEGVDTVEGQPAYKLKVTQKNGVEQHVWVDAKSFLDVKVEGSPKRMDGKMHPVYTYQRDFRSVQGVMIPFLVETAVDGYAETHKLQIEKAVVNQKFDDTLFSKPGA